MYRSRFGLTKKLDEMSSRRKQEKPQPRKNLVKGETDLAQDILTCGVCEKDFPLSEIVRFIQHKVNTCNKENNSLNKLFSVPPEDSDTDDEPDISSSTNLKTPNQFSKNYSSREPCSYICATCKQYHKSASSLLQHVQHDHGLYIYMDEDDESGVRAGSEQTEKGTEQSSPSFSGLRVPLLERQLGTTTPPIFPRSTSQELRMDLLIPPASGNHMVPAIQSSPPPLIEMRRPDASNHAPSSMLSCDTQPQLDFYSKRLRELAGATSPNALISSHAKLLQPNFNAAITDKPNSHHNTSDEKVSTTPPQLLQSSASSTTSENQPSSPKSNSKACEFCGKSFRFMSNLVVHRRSHTGEKPFKCHICDHACTQASKLKRHMKTHKRKKKFPSISDKPLALSVRNGLENCESAEEKKPNNNQVNGEYISDEHESNRDNGENRNADGEDDDEDEEIDVEDDDEDEEDEGDNGVDSKKTRELIVAEDLSNKKPMRNGVSENNVACLKIERKDNNAMRHSLLSEVMEKIGLASIQQYSEAYKQALKESSIVVKQERYSDGSASNDGLHNLERPAREGTRSAGQSPLNFNSAMVLSAFEQSMGHKRIKIEDEKWGDKNENSNMYAGMWIVPSYKDLYSADGNDRRKSKTESALNCVSPSGSGRSSSPRPGPSLSNPQGTIANSLLKPKEQRRNDTCEFCGKVFKNCSNLTVHRRSHTGEKPYKCELCSYACAQSSKLTRHMKTHGRLGKDVYRCRFCDMPFSVPSTLEKHMRKCVVSQTVGSSFILSDQHDHRAIKYEVLSERESDSK